jgi:UDPglucose 6-dehydrogenase
MKTIGIVGTGYVGLTTASVLAGAGYRVYAIDRDQKKISQIKKGKSDFFDPGLDDLVSQTVKSGMLVPVTDFSLIGKCDMVFICTGTPVKKDGSIDMKDNFSAVKNVLKNVKRDTILVQKSTVAINTGVEIKKLINKLGPAGVSIAYVSNPEFLREGAAVFDTIFFSRLVVGSDNAKAARAVISVYKKIDAFGKKLKNKNISNYAFLYIDREHAKKMPVLKKRLCQTTIANAELIKFLANSFLAMKISFANYVSRLSELTGGSSDEILDAVARDPRIGRDFLYPGIGYGGSCLGKDIQALISFSEVNGVEQGLFKAVQKINDDQIEFAVLKIRKHLGNQLKYKKAAFLGLSFKAGTSDLRDSPSIKLAAKLIKLGMKISAYDPHVKKENVIAKITLERKIEKVFSGAEVIVIGSEWDEFKHFDYSKVGALLKRKFILDGRNILNKKALSKIGFVIEGF